MTEASHDNYYQEMGGLDPGELNDESREGIQEPDDELLACSVCAGYLTQ